MASEMLRIAGRGIDGTAKAISTDNGGNVNVQLLGSVTKGKMEQLMTFTNKINGSLLESPHVSKYLINNTNTSPSSPKAFVMETSSINYTRISVKDFPAGVMATPTTSSGKYPIHLFSFDLITDLKNKGKIPKSWTVTELVNALKKITYEFIGFGEGSNGGVLTNGATLKLWDGTAWVTLGANTTNTYATIIGSCTDFSMLVANDGFLHFIVHPDYPSDATIISKIYSDYIGINVEFDADVVLTDMSKTYDDDLKAIRTVSTITKSALQRRTKIVVSSTISLSSEKIILDNYEFGDNVTAWALYGYENSRPLNHLNNGHLQLLIEFSNTSNNFNAETGGAIVFKKYLDFSVDDSFNNGLMLISSATATSGTNIIVANKSFNVPIAKYMRLTIINTTSTVAFKFLPFCLVEEGNF